MPETITCAAELTVALPRAEALALFTAEGERRWAPGWDPHYAAPGRTEGPGAVFVTNHARQTTWVMVDQDASGVRYARVTPGYAAGTVTVAVLESDESATRLRVTYDLSALDPGAHDELARFAAGYDAEIAEWERLVANL